MCFGLPDTHLDMENTRRQTVGRAQSWEFGDPGAGSMQEVLQCEERIEAALHRDHKAVVRRQGAFGYSDWLPASRSAGEIDSENLHGTPYQ